jgi:hypothetical protein
MISDLKAPLDIGLLVLDDGFHVGPNCNTCTLVIKSTIADRHEAFQLRYLDNFLNGGQPLYILRGGTSPHHKV